MNSSKKVIKNWLRAFFDDESTVEIKRKRIRIKSINEEGLKQVLKLLSKLKIYSRITGKNIDNSWYLNIYQNDLQKYKGEINFLHPLKKEKLNQLTL